MVFRLFALPLASSMCSRSRPTLRCLTRRSECRTPLRCLPRRAQRRSTQTTSQNQARLRSHRNVSAGHMSVPVHQKQSSNVSISSLPLLQANVVNRRLRSDFKCGFALYVLVLETSAAHFFCDVHAFSANVGEKASFFLHVHHVSSVLLTRVPLKTRNPAGTNHGIGTTARLARACGSWRRANPATYSRRFNEAWEVRASNESKCSDRKRHVLRYWPEEVPPIIHFSCFPLLLF